MQLISYGGVEFVTGSKHLLQVNNKHILIDCGMFQGSPELEKQNLEKFSFIKELDFVLLTHAHMDHSGLLPALVAQGYQGKVYTHEATKQLIGKMLMDGANILYNEYKETLKTGQQRKFIKAPSYNADDVKKLMEQIICVEWYKPVILDGVEVTFFPAGHILGASSVKIAYQQKSMIFSGDLGRHDDMIMLPPEAIEPADVVMMESTYGDRLHPRIDALEELREVVTANKKNKGILVIACFALARTQLLGVLLTRLFKMYPDLKSKVYIDSPLGIETFNVYQKYHNLLNIDDDEWNEVQKVLTKVEFNQQRDDLIKKPEGKIILTSSGMLEGGRVMGYLENFISNPKATFLLTGYQAENTMGRKLHEGAKEIQIADKNYKVVAKIKMIPGLSSHGDQSDLIKWLKKVTKSKAKVLLNHGQEHATHSLKAKIIHETELTDIEIVETEKTYQL
jgi:metallo-beta-lactamase family protein